MLKDKRLKLKSLSLFTSSTSALTRKAKIINFKTSSTDDTTSAALLCPLFGSCCLRSLLTAAQLLSGSIWSWCSPAVASRITSDPAGRSCPCRRHRRLCPQTPSVSLQGKRPFILPIWQSTTPPSEPRSIWFRTLILGSTRWGLKMPFSYLTLIAGFDHLCKSSWRYLTRWRRCSPLQKISKK